MASELYRGDVRRMPGLPSSAGKGPVVLFANVPFRSVWQRCHQLAAGLAELTDVVYVDPNRSFLQSMRRRPVVQTAEPLPPRLHLFSPPPGLPAARSVGLFNRWNYHHSAGRLRSFLRNRELWPASAVIVTFPDQADVLQYFPRTPLIYDLMDEPRLFLHPTQWPRYSRLHDQLLSSADVLVVSAHVLLERYRSLARRSEWISNGVRDELLNEALNAIPDPTIAKLPGPRLGYVGMISHWFDFDAVRAIAQRVPSGTVVLVGPTDVRPPDLPPNVVFTGPVPHSKLATVLAAFDVGLIPFVRSRAIDAVNPVKLYEYLAAGLPVLASDFEEVRRYRPLIHTYTDPASAADLATQLVAAPRTVLEDAERRAFARGHRWRAKAAQMAAAIHTALTPNRQVA